MDENYRRFLIEIGISPDNKNSEINRQLDQKSKN